MADINATQPIRFNAGGIFRIYDGASIDVTLINRESGTLEIEEGKYEDLSYQDRGVNQTSLEGDEIPSMIRIQCKLVKTHTNSLRALAAARNTSAGKFTEYSIDISIPDYKGAATGTKYTFTGCYFPKTPRVREGTRFDINEVEIVSRNPLATVAAY